MHRVKNLGFLELFREISSRDTINFRLLTFRKNKTARLGCFLQYSRQFWKFVNCAKKTPYAAGIGVHKASTGSKNENDNLQSIFRFPFARTLPASTWTNRKG